MRLSLSFNSKEVNPDGILIEYPNMKKVEQHDWKGRPQMAVTDQEGRIYYHDMNTLADLRLTVHVA